MKEVAVDIRLRMSARESIEDKVYDSYIVFIFHRIS